MRTLSEKIKAPGKRRTKEECRDCLNGNGDIRAGQDSGGTRCKSLSPYRNDREEGNSHKSSGHSLIGGILSQLISRMSVQINYEENHLCELKTQLRELEELSKHLDSEITQ